ncbi:MAG: glycosyltransferase [Flavobacteriales bacterium]|nr:glycosyltransferase [Flavobacteriales bacterium]
MKIIFWQNIISPHQSFLIRELANRHEVILAIIDEISNERIQQGWKIPETGKAKIIHLENKNIAFDLLDKNKKAFHLFSGIASYKILADVFRRIDKKAIIGVIVEAGSSIGWKRHLRKFLYRIKYLLYNNKINFLFAMGDLGVNYYHSVGFSKNKIHKFQYFTEIPDNFIEEDSCIEKTPKLIFIGQLIDRKNIHGLVNALVNLREMNFNLQIIGDGPLKNTLQSLVVINEMSHKIKFHGNMENNHAMNLLSKSDYLILPSNFDGWGAVINEALSRGVKVITNENCGGCFMVKEMNWGTVYKNNDKLELVLKNALGNFQKETLVERKRIVTQFADKYSNTIVNKFEQVLLTK